MHDINIHPQAPDTSKNTIPNPPEDLPLNMTLPEPQVTSLILTTNSISAPDIAEALLDYLTTPNTQDSLLTELPTP